MRILVACLSAVVLLAGTASAQSPQTSPGSLARPAREPGHVACRPARAAIHSSHPKAMPGRPPLRLVPDPHRCLIGECAAHHPADPGPRQGTGTDPCPAVRAPAGYLVPRSIGVGPGRPHSARGESRAAERPCRKLLPAHRLFGDPEPPTGRGRPRVPPEPEVHVGLQHHGDRHLNHRRHH